MQLAADPGSPLGSLVVYGLGAVGQGIVDDLLAAERPVDLILDRGKRGTHYRDIPVLSLDDMADGRLAGREVLLGLHNHYVDVRAIHADLKAAGASRVLSPVNLFDLAPAARTRPGYWLDRAFDADAHAADFARARARLEDEKSRALFDAILRYRRTGDLADCPAPSLEDEYVPADLPRYAEPLRVVDCGAFTGVAIHKFLKAGYKVESFAAFEPDPDNFATLARHDFGVAKRLCLPLGTWSSTCQLRFSSDGSMASRLSDAGDTVIQCVAVDQVLAGEPVNLVKLDVEGAEIETLKGMARIIAAQRPNLLVSAYHAPEHMYEIIDLIAGWDLGYRFHLRVHEHNTFGTVVYAVR